MAREVTQHEANLLTRFGFRLAKGSSFETFFYDQIVAIIPQENGMEVHFNSGHPLERAIIQVLNIDIPKGKFSGDGSPKGLDNAWIFVYYESMQEFKRDGSIVVL